MNNIFVFSLLLAVLFCSCRKEQNIENGDADDCVSGLFNTITIISPLVTNYIDGVFQVDCEIVSDEEGDAFILLGLLQNASADSPPGIVWCDEVPYGSNCTDRGAVFYNEDLMGRAFGSDVKVDGFQIRSYHQLYRYRFALQRNDPQPYYLDDFDLYAPTFEYPVFVKKIKVPKGPIHEKIVIRLPDGVNNCWGTIIVFRNSKDIEETMKMKCSDYRVKYIINEEWSSSRYDTYSNFFPDSSMFSYLITDIPELRLRLFIKSLHSLSEDSEYYMPLQDISDPKAFDEKFIDGGALYFN